MYTGTGDQISTNIGLPWTQNGLKGAASSLLTMGIASSLLSRALTTRNAINY